ncbi:zinc-finger domain-containing protein [Fictibacillus aquaticus]|uniref:RNA polymerase sigma-70 region 2 domain-containing protein n=1 Tax=Fictibacillus aquaticus TaxID=2021314 RepID=A0A235FAU6_9BACL|nr:zinc-finger domain-containing protein [Fictibacillus aquaticus]OYD58448.1 hypothetical protein CGZ90_00675 [Fictibacillus aquaticus]
MEALKEIEGNLLTKEDLVEKYGKLVYKLSNKFVNRAHALGLDREDIHSYGFIGLIKAFENWDPEKFNGDVKKFSTFAVPTILGYIKRTLRDMNPGVKFSRSAKETGMEIISNGLENESLEVIVGKLCTTKKKALAGLDYIRSKTQSLDAVVFDGGSGGDKETTLEQMLGKNEDFTNVEVEDFIQSLNPKEQIIVRALLRNKTQYQIGKELGWSQVHVSRTVRKIRPRLTQYLAGENEEDMDKKRVRMIANEIMDIHCKPCKKKLEFYGKGKDPTDSLNRYCAVECPAGRDLKKLGEILDIKKESAPKPKRKNKIKVREEKKMTVVAEKKLTKELLVDLLAQGKKNKEIAEEFGLDLPKFYQMKKEWGLTQPRVKTPPIEKLEERVREQKETSWQSPPFVQEMPKIEAFPFEEYEALKAEINALREEAGTLRADNGQLKEHVDSLAEENRDLKIQIDELNNRPQPEPFNRELYQELADLKDQYRTTMNLLAQSGKDYQEMKAKFEASTTFIKAVL